MGKLKTSSLRGTLALLLAASGLAGMEAPARAGETPAVYLDATLGSSVLITTSDSLNPIVDERTLGVGELRIGLAFSDPGEAFETWIGAGYLRTDKSATGGVGASMATWAITAGVTARYPLFWKVYAVGEVGLEALTGNLEVRVAGADFVQRAWAFGAQPRAGLELALPLGRVMDLRIRALGGFAFRTDLSFDAMGGGGGVRPLDLGGANLSGGTIGMQVAAVF